MGSKSSQKNIPTGWSLVQTSEIFSFVRTHAFSREHLANGTDNSRGIGNIHYGDLHSTYFSSKIDLRSVSVPMIKDESFAPGAEDFLRDGDLVMADASEDYDGVGVTVSIHGLGEKKVVGGLHTFVLRDKNKTNEYYRQYIFRNPKIRNILQKVANGVSVYSISKTTLSKVLLPLPPISEQERIVAVLKTWDEAIKKLLYKIELKNKAKKSLMIQLLNGKLRSSEFKNDWHSIKLGDVGRLVSGGTPSKKQNKFWEGDVPWISSSDLIEDDIEYINIHRYISDEAIKNSATNIIPEKSVIIVSRVGVGKVCVNHVPLCTSQDFHSLVINRNDSDPYFFAYLLSLKLQKLLLRNQGTSIKGFLNNDLKSLVIKIPDVVEQIRIVKILTAADSEIRSLKQKLSLIMKQKDYLLTRMLNGDLRVLEPTVVVSSGKI